MDKVSIIVPVYNVAPYLKRCIESLIGQTYDNIEILFIDDASSDGSAEILKKHMKQDSRIQVFSQIANQGVSAARNLGIDKAVGDWVCFCDADDWYELRYVEKMLDCAMREGADYIVCDYQLAYENRSPIVSGSVAGLYSGVLAKEVIACGPMSSCTHMIRRSLFTDFGVRYPVGRRQYEELCVISVLPKYATKVGVVDEALYNYFQRGNGTSASNGNVDSEKNFIESLSDMKEILGDDYHMEYEYHAIYALFYGEIMRMCKMGKTTRDIRKKIKEYEESYPNYRYNTYLNRLGRSKKLFLWMLDKRWIWGLRCLSMVHKVLVK